MNKSLIILALIATSGCQQIPNLEGEGISRSWKTPFFSDTISVSEIVKSTGEDGTVYRSARDYKHDTNVLGWGRTVTGERVQFEIKRSKPE